MHTVLEFFCDCFFYHTHIKHKKKSWRIWVQISKGIIIKKKVRQINCIFITHTWHIHKHGKERYKHHIEYLCVFACFTHCKSRLVKLLKHCKVWVPYMELSSRMARIKCILSQIHPVKYYNVYTMHFISIAQNLPIIIIFKVHCQACKKAFYERLVWLLCLSCVGLTHVLYSMNCEGAVNEEHPPRKQKHKKVDK